MTREPLTTSSRVIPEASRMTPHGREGKGRGREGKGIVRSNQVQIVKAVEGQFRDGLALAW